MIIDNLNLLRSTIAPCEANAPLVVDADAVLPASVALERFKAIPGRDAQVVQADGCVEHIQFAQGYPGDGTETGRAVALEKGLGIFATEAAYYSVFRLLFYRKLEA